MQKTTHKNARRPFKRVDWSGRWPRRTPSIQMLPLTHFSARGMELIYGRGDRYPIYYTEPIGVPWGKRKFHCMVDCSMEIRHRSDGHLFVRFKPNRRCLPTWTFELVWPTVPSDQEGRPQIDELSVPRAVRDEYEDYVSECLDWPDGD